MQREAGANVCQPPCNEKNYKAIIYKQKWPTDDKFAKAALNEYLNDTLAIAIQENRSTSILNRIERDKFNKEEIAAVRIYARSVDGMSLREDWAYSLSNLFSDFGGILGIIEYYNTSFYCNST